MKKETITGILVIATTIAILFVVKPRKSKTGKSIYSKPDSAEENDNEYANAVDSIKAYRMAMNNNEPKDRLDELNRELQKQFNIRIINKGGLLTATTMSGREIANEQV